MQNSPLHDLVNAISGLGAPASEIVAAGQARPDLDREQRTGKPEVIYARGKTREQVIELTRAFVEQRGRAIVSLISDELAAEVAARFPAHQIQPVPLARMLVVRQPDYELSVGGGVGILTAGTADLPVAGQVRVIAEEMGCRVNLAADVGVAGLHRLFGPLQQLLDAGADVLVVVAGMDGALPSVVSGLVDLPVIGVPTSTGYGFGGEGVAALLSMLQTCAPGLTVVNVDNGVGAGVTAALIANRVARARRT